MARHRRHPFSEKTLAFLRANIQPSPEPPMDISPFKRFFHDLLLFSMLGFVALLITTPFIWILALWTSIKLTSLWIGLSSILFSCGVIGYLPEAHKKGTYNVILIFTIGTLLSLALGLYSFDSIPRTIIEAPFLLAYALLYGWSAAEMLQDKRDKSFSQRLLLLSVIVLCSVCGGLACYYLASLVLLRIPVSEPLFPAILLILPSSLIQSYREKARQDKAINHA